MITTSVISSHLLTIEFTALTPNRVTPSLSARDTSCAGWSTSHFASQLEVTSAVLVSVKMEDAMRSNFVCPARPCKIRNARGFGQRISPCDNREVASVMPCAIVRTNLVDSKLPQSRLNYNSYQEYQ